MATAHSAHDDLDGAEAAAGDRASRATVFRSTWIVSSLETLRSSGHWERYTASLTEHREEILSVVAGTWLPLEVADAHYRACDALGLSSREVEAIVSSGEIRRAWYAPYIALAKRANSPWEVLLLLDRIWRRSVDGGAVSVARLRDDQARIDYSGCDLFDIAYFREGVRAVLSTLLGHICERPEVWILPQVECGEGRFVAEWT